jgi:hypothetical protein
MTAARIKMSFISLAAAALTGGFVVAYAQSVDSASCARIRLVPGGCGGKATFAEVYVDNMHKDLMIRATIRKHSGDGDDDRDYAVAEGGQLFIGCEGGGTSFAVVGCETLKSKAKKGD